MTEISTGGMEETHSGSGVEKQQITAAAVQRSGGDSWRQQLPSITPASAPQGPEQYSPASGWQ